MFNYKNIRKLGAGTGGLGLLVLIYNFYKMYGLVSTCHDDVDIVPCQAYNNWHQINKVGFVLLLVGTIIFIIGILKQPKKR